MAAMTKIIGPSADGYGIRQNRFPNVSNPEGISSTSEGLLGTSFTFHPRFQNDVHSGLPREGAQHQRKIIFLEFKNAPLPCAAFAIRGRLDGFGHFRRFRFRLKGNAPQHRRQ
jgi:hypothetical protein